MTRRKHLAVDMNSTISPGMVERGHTRHVAHNDIFHYSMLSLVHCHMWCDNARDDNQTYRFRNMQMENAYMHPNQRRVLRHIFFIIYTRASLAGGWAPPATLAEGGMDIQ